MDCFSSIFSPSFQDFYTIVLDELVLDVVARHRDDMCWMNTFSVMLYLRSHQQFVMRCGFLLVDLSFI
jgi:hypothetical protein